MGQIVLVMLVRRIGRSAAVGRDDFNNEEAFNALVLLRQNKADVTGVGTFAPGFKGQVIWCNHKGLPNSFSRCCTNVDDAIGRGGHRPFGFGGYINRPWFACKRRHAITQDAKILAIDFD